MTTPAQERNAVLSELGEAGALLAGTNDSGLVPAGGGNIGYAIRGARDRNDVAAITGGLTAERGAIRCAGPIAFGADPYISRLILTAMKFDPSIRSAAVIRFSDRAFRILTDMLIESSEADPEKFPRGTGTMDWAVASCCSEGVPEIIAIKGTDPEKQVICMFGDEPTGIASNIIILSNRIQ